MRLKVYWILLVWVPLALGACRPFANINNNNFSAKQAGSSSNAKSHSVPDPSCEKRLAELREKLYFLSGGDGAKTDTLNILATGYGAPPKYYFPEGQRRLLTMRASKIDAFRALAERVGGLHMWGGTTLRSMIIERDAYRTFVESYVRGARIVSVEAQQQNTYKTTVELTVNRSFLSRILPFMGPAYKSCLQQYPMASSTSGFYYSEH